MRTEIRSHKSSMMHVSFGALKRNEGGGVGRILHFSPVWISPEQLRMLSRYFHLGNKIFIETFWCCWCICIFASFLSLSTTHNVITKFHKRKNQYHQFFWHSDKLKVRWRYHLTKALQSREGRGGVSPPPPPLPSKKVLCWCALFAEDSFKCALFDRSNQQCIWKSTSKITSKLK